MSIDTAKGLRFFGNDLNNTALGGTAAASSSNANAIFAFDGLATTKWLSTGEGTDGNQVTLEMDYSANKQIEAFYIYNTNISDVEAQYWNGSAWVTADSSIATITKSTDLRYIFIKLTSGVTTTKVRLAGTNTISANSEKSVSQFLTFTELGQFEYFPKLKTKIEPSQNTFKTDSGKYFVIERGEAFTAELIFKSHVNQNDITLLTTLLERKDTFYIWPCGGDTTIFTYSFKPYRFKDIFKVAIVGVNTPELTKNYYKAGLNTKLRLLEVV